MIVLISITVPYCFKTLPIKIYQIIIPTNFKIIFSNIKIQAEYPIIIIKMFFREMRIKVFKTLLIKEPNKFNNKNKFYKIIIITHFPIQEWIWTSKIPQQVVDLISTKPKVCYSQFVSK